MGPEQWSHPWELNPKPIAYEAIALPIELGWHTTYYTRSLPLDNS